MISSLFFFLLVIFTGRSWALQCRTCSTILDVGACNDTHCIVQCQLVEHSCRTGMCHTEIALNFSVGHKVWGYALCDIGNSSRVKQEDLFSKEMLEGHCDVYDGQLNCECGFDDCNHVIQLPPKEITDETTSETNVLPYIVAGVIVGVILLLVLLIVMLRRCVLHGRLNDVEYDCKLTAGNRLSSDDASLIDGSMEEDGKHSFSTYKYSSSVATQYSRGSRGNSGNPHDQHLPIDLLKIVGRGRFAEVWKGKLQQEASNFQIVSIKVFRLRNYGSWRQEKDMLTEGWMRHENIIEFYASEQRTIKGRLQYWLVTAFYEQGSVGYFLRSNILEWLQFCDMAISIARGLAYLHTERDYAGRSKIPIAHRDVKSCNILVKDDCRSCVLADFGLSLKLDPELSRDELSNAGQVGTSRYMAPELLERLVNLTDIEMFKRVDVYAMSLVLWEMANRCEASEGMASPIHQPPFGDKINDHPTKQEMLVLVCRERQLPKIPDKWRMHKGLSLFVDEILSESWEYEAEARITARCVYERLLQLRNKDVTSGGDDEAKIRDKVENETNKMSSQNISTAV